MLLGQARKTRAEFEELALPHLDALYAMALRLTRNARDAEDLVQDTLLRAYRFFHNFERGTNCKAWLFKVLANLFNNGYRNRSREREILARAEDEGALYASPEGPDSPETEVVRKSTAAELQRALDALPPDFRLAVVLCDLEEFSYREIADIMGCPVGTVMSRLHRGRKLLREALARSASAPVQTGQAGAVVLPLRRDRDGGAA